VPLGEVAFSLLQEIGPDDVVEPNGSCRAIEAKEQRELVESTTELFGGE
jgi:hypothetical protein